MVMQAIVDEKFVPSAHIDSQMRGIDFHSYRDKHLPKHLLAYPAASSLPFARAPSINISSYDLALWEGMSPMPNSNYTKEQIAVRLWEVSDSIVENWSKGKQLFSSNITVSHNALM